MTQTILHVEDSPDLLEVVQIAFQHLGFRGRIITADSYDSAIDAVTSRRAAGQPLDLIIVDIDLTRGTGLDVIRAVKANPAWAAIPIVVLSNQTDRATITEAYALGASCYFPKLQTDASVLDIVEGLNKCWFQLGRRPECVNSLATEVLGRAIRVKAQLSELYMSFARLYVGDERISRLLMELALDESNLANLLAFFEAEDLEEAPLEPLAAYISEKESSLVAVQQDFALNRLPTLSRILHWTLQLEQSFDPGMITHAIGCLFPNGPAATMALTEGTVNRLNRILNLLKSGDSDLEIHSGARLLSERLVKLNSLIASSHYTESRQTLGSE